MKMLRDSDFPPLSAARNGMSQKAAATNPLQVPFDGKEKYGMSSIQIKGEKLKHVLRVDAAKEAEQQAKLEMRRAELEAQADIEKAERQAQLQMAEEALAEAKRKKDDRLHQLRVLVVEKLRQASVWTCPASRVPQWHQLKPVRAEMHSYDTRSATNWVTSGCAHGYYVVDGDKPCYKCPTCAILLRGTAKEVVQEAKHIIAIVCGKENSQYRHFEDLQRPRRRATYDDDFDFDYVDKSSAFTYYCILSQELTTEALDIARRRFIAAHQGEQPRNIS